MNQTHPNKPPPHAGISLNDVYFVLFRHKWLILAGCIIGIGGYEAVKLTATTQYTSEAKLMVRYVSDTKTLGGPANIESPGAYGDTIMQSEVAILTSVDLAKEVAKELAPKLARETARELAVNSTEVTTNSTEVTTNSTEVTTNSSTVGVSSAKGGGTNKSDSAASKIGGLTSAEALTREIVSGLTADVPKATTVIEVRFTHPDSTVAQEVLTSLLKKYRERHTLIHSVPKDFVTKKKDDLSIKVDSDGKELGKKREELRGWTGITSVEDAQKLINDKIAKLEKELDDAQLELAQTGGSSTFSLNDFADFNKFALKLKGVGSLNEWLAGQLSRGTKQALDVYQEGSNTERLQKRLLLDLNNIIRRGPPSIYTTQRFEGIVLSPATTNLLAQKPEGERLERLNRLLLNDAYTNEFSSANLAELDPTKSKKLEDGLAKEREQYQSVSALLMADRKKEAELRQYYQDESERIVQVRKAIAESEAKKKRLEQQYPQFEEDAVPVNGAPTAAVNPRARKVDLQKRIDELQAKLDDLRTIVAPEVDKVAAEIVSLQRQKEQDEASLRYYKSSVEQSEVESEYKVSNINTVQEPALVEMPKRNKKALMALVAGILGSIGFAFVLELFLDPRIKRAVDVQNKLHLPLFLAIPEMGKNGHKRIRAKAASDAPTEPPEAGAPAPGQSEGLVTSDNGLAMYSAALRDRLMFYFHSRNMTHKPKLVGVTSCSRSAGATTIAAGLAAALSETREGNVLLVDMNLPGGVAHPFHRGKPGCGLQDALEGSKRSDAFVQDGLYLASALEPTGRNASIPPRRFSELMPKLKSSDYDFIIFDMPAVTQTSATAHLAALLDLSFVVLESGKTNREAARRAASMLEESQVNIAVILNKTRTYVPAWLAPET